METAILYGVGKKIRYSYLNGKYSESMVMASYNRNKKEANNFYVFGYRKYENEIMLKEMDVPSSFTCKNRPQNSRACFMLWMYGVYCFSIVYPNLYSTFSVFIAILRSYSFSLSRSSQYGMRSGFCMSSSFFLGAKVHPSLSLCFAHSS